VTTRADATEALRREVAAAHGLGAEAATFLTGTTSEQLEASAGALAGLLGGGGDQRGQDSATEQGLLTGAAAAKQRKQEALLAALLGRPQPRDESGRFTTRAIGFDGGARQPVPVATSPQQAHAELLGHLITASRVYRGDF
jgi:hypothetical protein